MKTALVLGAGGFIGSHMVKRLKSEGYWVRGVDLKYPEFSETEADHFVIHDLTHQVNLKSILLIGHGEPFEKARPFDEVYQFAADMGGAGYVFSGDHDADIMSNSALINLNICEVLKGFNSKIFYSSSACMYPQEIQTETKNAGLKESDAFPGNPDSIYGWEKLFSELLYLSYARNYGLDIRIARFHNIFGPEGTWQGGKEKAPAAICRKVIQASNYIEIWGDGEQTRSFLYIDDCIDAVRLLIKSNFKEPINIGSEEFISINNLAVMAMEIEGKFMELQHDLTAPTGVRGRTSDNTLIREVLNWEPKVSLRKGLTETYKFIQSQI
jgi:GDP-D-mannose 3',5'-epimerase